LCCLFSCVFYVSVIVLFFAVFKWCPGAYYAVLLSCSCGVVLPIMLCYCRVVVMGCPATYYLVLLSWSCRGVSCYLLLFLLSLSLSCRVVSCYLFYFLLLLLLYHVVLPIMLVDCCVLYCIILPDRRSRTTTILNCVYLEMGNLGGRGARKRLRCVRGNISKLNRQIFLQRGSLQSQE
jgi:hypothetical protein